MSYASPSDVAQRWGRPISVEDSDLIDVRLEDVERMILRRVPDLYSSVAAGSIDVDDLIQIESDAVLRLVRNPQGLFSETDGNYTYMYMQGVASGRLEILPEEWAVLGVYASGMSAIDPVGVRGFRSSAGTIFGQGG